MLLPSLSLPAGHVVAASEYAQIIDAINDLSLFVRKAADETVTNNASLQDDNELFLPVKANATYEMRMFLLYQATTAGDFQMTFTGPAGATLNWELGGLDGASTALSGAQFLGPLTLGATGQYVGGIGAGSTVQAHPNGTLITGGTAGTLQFRFAQMVAAPATSAICKAGSALWLHRVA